MVGVDQSIFAIDMALLNQLPEALFQAERTFVSCNRDFLMEVLQGVATNMLSGSISDHQ